MQKQKNKGSLKQFLRYGDIVLFVGEVSNQNFTVYFDLESILYSIYWDFTEVLQVFEEKHITVKHQFVFHFMNVLLVMFTE